MSLRKINTENKLISICIKESNIYIGDSLGFLLVCRHPFLTAYPIFRDNKHSPISSICTGGDFIFYSNWGGEVTRITSNYKDSINKKLEDGISKCIKYFKGTIFVSINLKVYNINENLEIIKVYEMCSKVLCMEYFKSNIYCGMTIPYLGILGGESWLSNHSTSILCINAFKDRILTTSADNTIRKLGREIIYEGKEWIRTIYEDVFSEGNNLMILKTKNANKIYSHELEVTGVVKYNETIISIGLDCCIYIYSLNEFCFSDEERELEDFISTNKS